MVSATNNFPHSFYSLIWNSLFVLFVLFVICSFFCLFFFFHSFSLLSFHHSLYTALFSLCPFGLLLPTALCNVNFRNTYLRILKCQWSVKDTRAKRAAANLDAQQGHRYQSHLKHQQLRHQAKRQQGQYLSSLADRSSDSTSLRVVTDVETDCNKCPTEGEASRGSVESKSDRVTSKEVPSLARKKKLSKKM